MKKFHITETKLVEMNWFYAVEAETLEEALRLVKGGAEVPYGSEKVAGDPEYAADELED